MGGVVVMVSVAGVPGVAELGLTEHCGASWGAGCTMQVKDTALLNPFTLLRVTVAVAEPPAVTGLGARSVRLSKKSGTRLKVAVTV